MPAVGMTFLGMLLAACAGPSGHAPDTPTRSELDAVRNMLADDPAHLQAEMRECQRDSPRQTPERTANMAVIMGVPPDRVHDVLCERIMDALRSGRLTASMYQANAQGEFSPEFMAVIQGR